MVATSNCQPSPCSRLHRVSGNSTRSALMMSRALRRRSATGAGASPSFLTAAAEVFWAGFFAGAFFGADFVPVGRVAAMRDLS